MNIVYLADHPKLVPVLAEWAYKEWNIYDPSYTKEKALNSFKLKLNYNKLPLTLVAIEETVAVGMISLKSAISPTGYADKGPWISSLYVIPGKRGIGLGKILMLEIKKAALALGYNELFLFTSVPQAKTWYENLGWEKITTDLYQNHQIIIMNYIIQKKHQYSRNLYLK